MLVAVIAMQKEADALLSQARVKRGYTLCGKQIFESAAFGIPFSLVLAGIGKTNAAAAAMLAVHALQAEALLNFGLAGGVSPQAELCETFRVTRAVQYDFDLSEINGTAVGTLNEYATPYFTLTGGKSAFAGAVLATGDRFTSTAADLPLLHSLGADLRDMEGAAIAHVAAFTGTPLYMYKAVSDRVGAESVHEYERMQGCALQALAGNMRTILEECYGRGI